MAYGLRPVRHLSGGVMRANEYPIAASYATAIYTGDPVVVSAGNIQQATAASTAIVGVFAGVQYTKSDGEVVFSRHWPGAVSGATDIKAFVHDDPALVFSVEDDAVADYLTAADMGSTGSIVVGTGSTVTGQSGVALDTSTVGTGTAFRVLRKLDKPGNDFGSAAGDKVEVEVLIAQHVAR